MGSSTGAGVRTHVSTPFYNKMQDSFAKNRKTHNEERRNATSAPPAFVFRQPIDQFRPLCVRSSWMLIVGNDFMFAFYHYYSAQNRSQILFIFIHINIFEIEIATITITKWIQIKQFIRFCQLISIKLTLQNKNESSSDGIYPRFVFLLLLKNSQNLSYLPVLFKRRQK